MLSDAKLVLTWWLTIFSLSVVAWPLTFCLFKKFWDRGYVFAKIIAISFLTYLILVAGVFKIIPFTRIALFSIIISLLLIDILFLLNKKNRQDFFSGLLHKWPIFLSQEILFGLILFGWSYVRGFSPDIESLEKFMDWGFVNSALRGQYLPPVDMWFSGYIVNYYYFGQVMIAVLTRLSGINSTFTYNLAIASTCALTFTSAFSLVSNIAAKIFSKFNLKMVITAGIISATLLTFGGNLHTVYKIGSNIIKNEGQLVLNVDSIKKAAKTYWYPDATRFIGFDPDTKDKTIHEFPLYSFVVSDLHGHMNDIPVVLFFMALLFAVFTHPEFIISSFLNWKLIIFSGFILSVAFMTNAWDFAVYGLLYAISYFLISRFSLLKTCTNGIMIVAVWIIFTFPFSNNFIPMTEGLRLSDVHSPFYQLFILYGGFWLISLFFLLYVLSKKFKKLTVPDFFVLSLILTATILVLIPEVIYIKDIYIEEYRRANTMFKLVYQAFIIYSLCSGYILVRLSSGIKSPLIRFIFKILFLIIFISHMIYPYFAIKSYSDHHSERKYWGLYGLDFLRDQYPDNFQAIKWINQNISGQPVMLEAVGDSYTSFNHVSMATGLPTVQGWIVHEWLWRGGYDQPAARQADVQKIYESENSSEVHQLLQKYDVKYVFVGTKEVEKYPNLNESNFTKLGQVIFTSGNTKIYQLN